MVAYLKSKGFVDLPALLILVLVGSYYYTYAHIQEDYETNKIYTADIRQLCVTIAELTARLVSVEARNKELSGQLEMQNKLLASLLQSLEKETYDRQGPM